MSDPALSPIYNRLNGTSQYHPFSAETFADWSSEAGDTVQITRDGVTYSAPIHQQTITWHGAHRVTMESGGTKDREATERTSNRKYRNSSGGVSSQKSALKQIRYDFYDNNGALHGLIEVTAQGLTTAFQNADAGLQSQITQEAGRISLVVEGTGANAHIKPASIVAAINAQTGSSSVKISADQIELTGQVIASALTVDDDIACGVIDCSRLTVAGTIECLDVEAASVEADVFLFAGDHGSFTDCVSDVTVNSNTGLVTLTFASGRTESFNRAAATVSGSWGSGVFTVTGASNALFTSLTNSGHWGDSGASENPNIYYYKTYATIGTSQAMHDTGNSTTIDATARYNAGVNAAKAAVALTSAWTGDATNGWTFTVSNSANSRTSATTITRTIGTWSNHKLPITISATNKPESRLWQWSVDATNVYNSVTVSTVSAPAASGEVTSTTVTATASNGNTKTATLSMAKGTPSASGGYASASLGGTVVARIAIGNWWDAGYKAGYNQACSDAGISGNTGSVYTGTWYGTLYVAPTGGATAIQNCVGQATSHTLTKKT